MNTWLRCFRGRDLQPASGSFRVLLNRQHGFHCWSRGSVVDALRLLILLPLIWVEGAWAVDCANTNYDLNFQYQVDALGATGCDRVSGDLIVQDPSWGISISDITNLDSLTNITSVGGSVRITDTGALSSIDGLINLNSVGANVYIYENSALINVGGLAGLTSISQDLAVVGNNSLANIDGLTNLNSVGGWLSIVANNRLDHLSGLDSLSYVGGDLSIEGNRELGFFGWGFWKLKEVGGSVRVTDNRFLSDLHNFGGISSIGQSLTIERNAFLRDIRGLINVSSLGGDLRIRENPDLNYCTGVAPLLGWPNGPPADTVDGTITIENNGEWWCSSIEEVLDQVNGPTRPLITGAVASGGSIRLEFDESTPNNFAISGYEAVCRSFTTLTASGPGSPLILDGTTPGGNYICTVAPVTKLGVAPASYRYDVTVPNAPAAPIINKTDYGDSEVILYVAVTDDGGSDVTEYVATCTDGENALTGSSTSSPVTVSGLTNGVAYTCTVTAANSEGASSVSLASDPTTPQEAFSGLPVWLSYLSTQQANSAPASGGDGVTDSNEDCVQSTWSTCDSAPVESNDDCVQGTWSNCDSSSEATSPTDGGSSDADGDGVPDSNDACPSTPPTEEADASGCSDSQS